MSNETLQNNMPEGNVGNNASADLWQNMAAKVQETTKNMNKYDLGKRALRATIVGLTALTLAAPSFSKQNKTAPKDAPVSVEWAEPATNATDNGINPVDQSPATDQEAAAMFAEARQNNPTPPSENPWEANNPQQMAVTPDLPPNAIQQ